MNTIPNSSRTDPIRPEAFLRVWRTGEFDVPVRPLLAWLQGHRLLPLLAWRAEQEGWALPEAVAAAARHVVYAAAARSLIAQHQLSELTDVAAAVDVPVVVVKGPVVAEAFPEEALRIYNDIDLLVADEHALRLIRALQDVGYSVATEKTMRVWHYPALVPDGHGLQLEIHTSLAQDEHRCFTFEDWEGQLRPWKAGLLAPDLVHHTLYLIHHFVNHHQFALGALPLADLYFMVRHWDEEAWMRLIHYAADCSLERSVRLAFDLVSRFWQDPFALDSLDAWEALPSVPEPVAHKSWQMTMGEVSGRGGAISRDLPQDLRGWFQYLKLVLFGDPASKADLTGIDRVKFYVKRPFSLINRHGAWLWRLLWRRGGERGAWRAHRDVTAWLRGGSSTPPSPSERR